MNKRADRVITASPRVSPRFPGAAKATKAWDVAVDNLMSLYPGRVATPYHSESDAWGLMITPYDSGVIRYGLAGWDVFGMVSVCLQGVLDGGKVSPQAIFGTDARKFHGEFRALRDTVRYRNAVERVLAKHGFRPDPPAPSDHFDHANLSLVPDAIDCVAALVADIAAIRPTVRVAD